MNKTAQLFSALALAAAFSSPVSALTLEGSQTQGATVFADYSSTGEISFDIDFANLAPAVVEYRLDADDVGMPITFSAIFRNVAGGVGFPGYSIQLGAGSFGTVGSVVRQFGGSTAVSSAGGLATLSFNTPEFLDVEVGDALGNTPGALDWTLQGLQAGDRLSITVSVVPEPGTWALCFAGLGAVATLVRRRRA